MKNKSVLNFIYLSLLKYPSILNEIIPFVTIISVSFLIRNLVNNNELVSMRNLGYSIFDIFTYIISSFYLVYFFFFKSITVFMERKYDTKLDNKEDSLYSIKIQIMKCGLKMK